MHAGVQRTHSRVFGAGTVECMGEVYSHADRKLSMLGEVHSHGATQPCIQAKSTRHPRGCVGRSPTIFFIFFYFFPVKIT